MTEGENYGKGRDRIQSWKELVIVFMSILNLTVSKRLAVQVDYTRFPFQRTAAVGLLWSTGSAYIRSASFTWLLDPV
jgi:hypothetical protein